MRLVFGLVLLIGVGLAGFAVYMAQGYIHQYESALNAEREAQKQMVQVVDIYVAGKALRYGEKLTPDMVKLIKFPEQSLPEGAFKDAAELFPNDNERPRTVLRAIEPNEPLLASKVTGPGQEAGIAAFLAGGMRAFTIDVNVTTGVSGFLSPGDRVDVFWTGQIGGQGITRLIQSSVKIIGINQSADQDRMSTTVARTVTVEVTPEEVAKLAQAQQTGTLSLALVGASDTTQSSDIQVNLRQVLGTIETEAPKVCVRTERRGSEVVTTEVPCP